MPIEVTLIPVTLCQLGMDHRVDGGRAGVDEGSKLRAGPGKPPRIARGDVEQHARILENHASPFSAGRGHDFIGGQIRGRGTNGFSQPCVEGGRSAAIAFARFHLKGIRSRHELDFGARQQSEALAQGLRDGNLAFDGDNRIWVLPRRYYRSIGILPRAPKGRSSTLPPMRHAIQEGNRGNGSDLYQ